MVNFVYGAGPRVAVDSNLTVGQAIEKVVSSPSTDHCVFFNDHQLDNDSTIIAQIPGIKDDYTLRVRCKKIVNLTLPENMPTFDEIRVAFSRLTENEFQRIATFLDKSTFKQEVLNKVPALASDCELLSIVTNLTLIVKLIKKKDEDFLKQHPMFIPAIYTIFEKVFNNDALGRLFSKQSYSRSNPPVSAADLQQFLGLLPGAANTPMPSTTRTPPVTQNRITNEMFANALQAIGGGNAMEISEGETAPGSSATSTAQPPEEQYRTQLEQLSEFGFTNVQENIQALILTSGNLELALELIRPSDSPQQPIPKENAHQTFATQLEQLKEYGFTDVNECLEALIACEGNIENALELIIANRERDD